MPLVQNGILPPIHGQKKYGKKRGINQIVGHWKLEDAPHYQRSK